MPKFYYLRETPNRHKLAVLFINILALFLIAVIIFLIFSDALDHYGFVTSLRSSIYYHMSNFTALGMFYIGLIGALFFVPIPQEIPYYYSLLKGNNIALMTVLVNAGFLLAQVVNYTVGRQLHGFFMHIVSKRKVYKVRRFINNYGAKGILVFNILPLPAPLLTFGLGIARYNVKRLFFWMIIGLIIKHMIIISFFLATN